MSNNPTYKRAYYLKHQERLKAKARVYREANLVKVREYGKKASQARRAIDPELAKERARGYALKRKYGLTLEQYDELLKKQNNSCAICERHESEFKTSLAVDHDHHTQRIRGLLCTSCNYRMVARHRDGELLRKIADYIEQGTDWFAPKKPRKRAKRKAPDAT